MKSRKVVEVEIGENRHERYRHRGTYQAAHETLYQHHRYYYGYYTYYILCHRRYSIMYSGLRFRHFRNQHLITAQSAPDCSVNST